MKESYFDIFNKNFKKNKSKNIKVKPYQKFRFSKVSKQDADKLLIFKEFIGCPVLLPKPILKKNIWKLEGVTFKYKKTFFITQKDFENRRVDFDKLKIILKPISFLTKENLYDIGYIVYNRKSEPDLNILLEESKNYIHKIENNLIIDKDYKFYKTVEYLQNNFFNITKDNKNLFELDNVTSFEEINKDPSLIKEYYQAINNRNIL